MLLDSLLKAMIGDIQWLVREPYPRGFIFTMFPKAARIVATMGKAITLAVVPGFGYRCAEYFPGETVMAFLERSNVSLRGRDITIDGNYVEPHKHAHAILDKDAREIYITGRVKGN